MFLLGYFEDGTPVMGLPGCVMYAGATVFDLVLPKVAADVPVTRADIAAMGEGGLCLGCKAVPVSGLSIRKIDPSRLRARSFHHSLSFTKDNDRELF